MSEQNPNGYRVLARKYRPDRFSELIGQEALVRTLGNALSLGRLAHAFVLTGVRGGGQDLDSAPAGARPELYWRGWKR